MRFVCPHCDTPLADDARRCDACGAPVREPRAASLQAPDGFAVFEDLWRGLRLHYPEGWSVHFPAADTLEFHHPDDQAWLRLELLPPRPVGDAAHQARARLSLLGEIEVRDAMTPRPEQARMQFRTPDIHGQILVRLTPRGGTVLTASRREASDVDLQRPTDALLRSLAWVAPIPREPWTCPQEASFRIQVPTGWAVQSTITMDNNIRTPWFRANGDPSGQVAVFREPQPAMFVNGPLLEQEPEPEGFFASVGRFMQQAAQAMSMFPTMPYQGLEPVVEHFYLPRIREHVPGVKLLGVLHQPGDPRVADVRLEMPDGVIQVLRLESMLLPPSPMGDNIWLCVVAWGYQAPPELLATWESVMRGIALSFEVNPQWQAAEGQRQHMANAQRAQMAAQQHQQRMAMQQQSFRAHQANMASMSASMDAHNASWMAGQAVSDASHASYMDQQAMSDAGHAQTIHGIRETAEYNAPSTWSTPTVEVSNHVEAVWADPAGNLFGGDAWQDVPADWERLTPTKGS